MVMCEYYYDPSKQRVERGLNLVANACVLPHHNTFGKNWAAALTKSLPDVTLLGIDERTGMLSTDSVADSRTLTDMEWETHGGGGVTLYRGGSAVHYGRGGRFSLG
jgi:cyanophycinase